MVEDEMKILNVIAKALPNMSEFDKGYFLGIAESKVANKEKQEKEQAKTTKRLLHDKKSVKED